MIRSMTGFGAGTATTPAGDIAVEVRSVNNRFLDFSVRLPHELAACEAALRDEARRRLRRGKVEMTVRFSPSAADGAAPPGRIDGPLLRAYARAVAEALAGIDGMPPPDTGALLALPGVVTTQRVGADADGALARATLAAARAALDALDAARATEGAALAAAIAESLATLETLRDDAAAAKDRLMAEHEARLLARVQQLRAKVDPTLDPGRVAAELALVADRCDITEELVRLEAHLAACRKTLTPENPEPAGKPVDFLAQELLREANTLGGKARSVEAGAAMLAMKAEIEKIKEQVANLE